MSFWNSTLVAKSRKVHRCATCGRETPKGEAYRREAGMHEGDFVSFNQCVPCHDFVKRHIDLGNIDRCEGYTFDELPYHAREAGEPWPPQPQGDPSSE